MRRPLAPLPLCCVALLTLACDGRRPYAGRAAPASNSGDATAVSEAPKPFREQQIAPEAVHPFSARDLLALDRVGDPQVSPDGKRVVYTLRKTDLDQNRGRKDLWVVGLDGKAPIQLSSHPDNEDSPRWLPNSHQLLFLAKHDGKQQVWRTAIDGAAPTVVTQFPLDVASYAISADGRNLAFSADVFPDCEPQKILACTAERLELRKGASSGQLHTRLFVRH